MIHFKANTRRAAALSDDLITTTSVGIEVRFLCSAAWEGLTRIAIFRGSDESVDVLLSGDICTVPPQVLAKPGGPLLIGLYGSDGSGHLVIPTVWADAGRILPGAVPSGVEPTPEEQTLLDQLIEELNDAQDALEEAASHIIESGITSEEREKLAGIEAGAEVNVIEEVRYFDVLRQEYRPLPVTNKGVNLPRNEIVPENNNDVVYVDFEIDADGNVTLSPFAEPIIDAVNVHGQTVIARVKISNDSQPDFLPLIHLDSYNIRFAGFTAAEEKLDIWYDLIQHRWRAQFKELVDWDSADNSYIWANQGSENSGKVMKVGSDGVVTPQDAASGTQDYSDLSNKPQINSVTLSGNKSLSDLGIEAEAFVVAITESNGTYVADKTASQILEAVAAKKRVVATLGVIIFQYCLQGGGKAYFTAIYNNTSRLLAVAESKVTTVSVITIGTYSKPYDGIPASDLAAAVQTSLGKADTALQQHQDISGKLDKNQGTAHAGEFLVVGSDGNVTTVTMSAWTGGAY